MKKTVFLMGFLLIGLVTFGQYTGNKLPSGLTVADTASDADITVIQKAGETYVKGIRMDSLRSYMTEGINADITSLDSVAGDFGQFVISDGVGFLAPVSAKFEGNNAYTFGSRLSGTVGAGSFVIGRGRATGIRSNCINGVTASGVDAISINGSTVSGDRSCGIGLASVSGDDAMGWNSGTASGDGSTSWNFGESIGDNSTSWNSGSAIGEGATAWNSGSAIGEGATAFNRSAALGDYSMAIGDNSFTTSYQEFVIGTFNDTAATSDRDSWVATDRIFTIGNGTSDTTTSNALTILKNGNATFSGNITADTITGYVRTMSSFGELWVADGAVGQAIANGTTYVKMTGFVRRGEYENMTVDSTNDKITITETGYYLVNISVSSISGTNGVVTRTAAFLNNAEVDKIHAMQTISNTASPNPVSCSGIIKVTTVPVDLDVRRRHDNGAPVTFTMVYGNLSCHKIAEL